MSTRSPIGKVLVALAMLVVAGATLVLGLVRAGPAAAAASCVAVVVDFRQLGGAVQTGCAQGDPSTGLQALGRAGFGYAPRPRDGLICQIDARPACTASTNTTYWSYWYRAPGSSRWVYASEGAGTHNPKPGSTEAWVWQNGGKTPPPNIRADVICPQLAATATPKPTPKPSRPKPTGTTSGKPTSKPSTREASAPARSTRQPSSPASTTDSRRSSDLPTTSAISSPATSSAAPLPATQAPPTDGTAGAEPPHQGGGGALGGVAGVALGGVVVLGIGAATVVRARAGKSS